MNAVDVRNRTHAGYSYLGTELDGSHEFQKQTSTGWMVLRCLPEDMDNGNFEWLAEHNMTNTNRVPRRRRR